jgi:hypothetical protein
MAEVQWGPRERPLSEREYQALLTLWCKLLADPDAEDLDKDKPASTDERGNGGESVP